MPFFFDIIYFMQPKIFDIHSHLNFPDFDPVNSASTEHGASGDREAIIEKMRENGIWTICVGADEKTSQECVDLAEKYENIFASVGLHPTEDIKRPLGHLMSKLSELAKNKKVVAIGECGLDFYRNPEARNPKHEIRNKQIKLFKEQIKLALEINKPLMIHCREAHDDLIEILKAESQKLKADLRGNIHFFSGTWEQAQKYFELGLTISFAGPTTFADQYDETIKNSPIDKIMIETDAPFAAPAPYRSKRNEPSYVIEIAKKIAEIKNMKTEDVLATTTSNAMRLFLGQNL